MIARPPDHYALLGIPTDANADTIRAAYRALAKLHHPDLADNEGPPSTEKFLEIQQAYDVLRDPLRRAQYDYERARRAEMEAERRRQRDIISGRVQPTPAAPPRKSATSTPQPATSPRGPVSARVRLYARLSAVALMVIGLLAGYHGWEYYTREPALVTIVRTDEARRPGPLDGVYRGERLGSGAPSSLVELSNEMERLARQQASRAEAAKSKPDVPSNSGNTGTNVAAAPATTPRTPAAQPSTSGARRVDCAGEGRSFYVIREKNATSVSYNGGPPVTPVQNEASTGVVVLSKIEPTGRISLGFVKGNKDGAIVVISDAVGNIFRTFGVDCSAAVF